LDRIVLTQTTKRNHPRGIVGWADENNENVSSVTIFHDAPHILKLTTEQTDTHTVHTDIKGRILAGSNTDHNGSLCLGDAYSMFDWSALDLLCNSKANKDYEWRGPNLIAHTNKRYSKTTIKEWPSYGRRKIHIPSCIKKLTQTW
tara:strand:- start:728 stop:1162 length:435 start_codon:yes stop_codon:yes gene_type:complete